MGVWAGLGDEGVLEVKCQGAGLLDPVQRWSHVTYKLNRSWNCDF